MITVKEQIKALTPILVIHTLLNIFYKCLNTYMRADKVRIDVRNTRSSKVDLNDLIRKVKEEEKKSKKNNLVISAAAVSVVAVFGIILTL